MFLNPFCCYHILFSTCPVKLCSMILKFKISFSFCYSFFLYSALLSGFLPYICCYLCFLSMWLFLLYLLSFSLLQKYIKTGHCFCSLCHYSDQICDPFPNFSSFQFNVVQVVRYSSRSSFLAISNIANTCRNKLLFQSR